MTQQQIDGMRLNGKMRSHTTVGGYPIFYLDGDDSCLCPSCADEELRWEEGKLSAAAVNWDSLLHCDQCSNQIEAAYDLVED